MGEPFQLGRYSLHAELAAGGMATVYLGRLNGAVGFGRMVAIKRLHPHLARDPDFVSMFLDEARLAARIQHPNVVPTIDVVATDRELFLVLEYVRGETLGALIRAARAKNEPMPVPVALAIITGMLNGLHAAHEATDEKGVPLAIVHRDVSPQNVIVGADGIARVLDFGVAKAATRLQTTREGQLKGKLPYMAPEQLQGEVTRKTDIYAAGVVLWETLTHRRLFKGETEAQILSMVVNEEIQLPSSFNPSVSKELDQVTMKALSRNVAERFATTREMAEAIDACARPASAAQVAEWLANIAGAALDAKRVMVSEIESGSGASRPNKPEALRAIDSVGPGVILQDASGPDVQSVGSFSVGKEVVRPSRTWMVAFGVVLIVAISLALFAAFRLGSRSVTAAAQPVAPIEGTSASVLAPSAAPSVLPTASATTTPTASVKKPAPTVRKPSPSATPDVTSLIDTRR